MNKTPNINTKPTVLATGVFHILHPDHIRLFEYASIFGDLTVGINTDDYVIKKSGKILIPLVDRVYTIKSLRFVNRVVVFPEPNACELIRRIQPNFFVKGSDYRGIDIPELEVCKEIDCKLLIAPHERKFSSSELLKI